LTNSVLLRDRAKADWVVTMSNHCILVDNVLWYKIKIKTIITMAVWAPLSLCQLVMEATGDSPFFLIFAHDPRLPFFDMEKPRMFYDSSYVSDMYEISRAAHKAAKENFEEQRDRQEPYYDKKTKYRTFAPGQQVIIYYPNPPPGVSPKFHIFWKTFTVIEMVGRVNLKTSQHNKKPIVVHIDRVLDFDASRSEKEQTENILCIGIDLEAEREWAILDRVKALGQQEDEEKEEQEVQWHIYRRTAGASLLHPSSSSTRQPVITPKRQTLPPSPPPPATAESDRELLSTPPLSCSSGTRQPPLLPPIGKKKKRSKCQREAAEGKPPRPAQAERERERGAARLLRRAARAAKAEQQAERPDTGWLDSFTQMGVAIYGRNNKLLVPCRRQEDPAAVAENGAPALLMSEEDPAAVAERAAAMLMSEQTEPTLQQQTHTRSSQSRGHGRSNHGRLEDHSGHCASNSSSSSRTIDNVQKGGERSDGAFSQHWTSLPRRTLWPHYRHVRYGASAPTDQGAARGDLIQAKQSNVRAQGPLRRA
jgi:hypothetical protein